MSGRHLLAGAVAMDSVTDLARRYRELPAVGCNARCIQRHAGIRYGYILQRIMRREVGGTPGADEAAYGARSPLRLARRIASSGVPLEIWWSRNDRIVTDQRDQSGRLAAVLRRLEPRAQVVEYVGDWPHSSDMRADTLLPVACARLGLVSWAYARSVAARLRGALRLPAHTPAPDPQPTAQFGQDSRSLRLTATRAQRPWDLASSSSPSSSSACSRPGRRRTRGP